ncbi:substrate-binding domain-containing protein [Zobellella maritima]|uniref:hypothetical protein n=1 Tax=Zobellella maritima TaxID=2059725 RepID=UPI0013009256|nr:hypothetical protein [Zobellella maritima]
MNLVASLPWYDLPVMQQRLDDFWSELKAQLHVRGAAPLPEMLERRIPLAQQWADPGLVISQCCGPDLFTLPAQLLRPVARPIFSDLDCTPGHYFSHIVTASGAGKNSSGRFVVNSTSSRSGCAALFEWATVHGRPCEELLVSGSHAASLDCLRAGHAELAAIDAHSWPLLDTEGIVILGRSTEAPAPPFVMHKDCLISPGTLLEALGHALERAGERVNIKGILATDARIYKPINQAGILGTPARRRTSAGLTNDRPTIQNTCLFSCLHD